VAYDAEFTKDPDAVLDYTRDWGAYLGGDEISVSSWSADEGITIESSSSTASTATVWLSGGTARSAYRVTNRIVTAGGRTDERSFLVVVSER
jgi:hypothetical protein